MNGTPVSNYIVNNTLTSTLLNYQSKLNNTTNKLPYDNLSGTPDLVNPTFTGGNMNLVNGNKCQFSYNSIVKILAINIEDAAAVYIDFTKSMSVLNNLSVQGTSNIAGGQLSLIHPNQFNMSYNNTSKEMKIAIGQTDEFFIGGTGNISSVGSIRGGNLIQSNNNPCTQTNYSTTTTINLPANAAITYLTPNLSSTLRGTNLWTGSAHAITVTGLYLIIADWRYVNSQTDSTFNYTLWSTAFHNQTTNT